MGSKAPLGAASSKIKSQKSDLSMTVQSTVDVTENVQNQPSSDSPQQVGYINLHAPVVY